VIGGLGEPAICGFSCQAFIKSTIYIFITILSIHFQRVLAKVGEKLQQSLFIRASARLIRFPKHGSPLMNGQEEEKIVGDA
jgi:hypothetical protein